MALAYRPPGISVEEVITTSISPILAAPALVCLVGAAQGFQTRMDQFVVSGTSAIPLPGLGDTSELVEILKVQDTLHPSNGAPDGSGYDAPSDYTVQVSNGTITRVSSGAIEDGTLVNVTYTYVSADYFLPARCYDQSTVENRYGAALTADGLSINSPLSYAASIAFENGAGSVVCQPLFHLQTAGDQDSAKLQPTAPQSIALSTWQDTLFPLRDIEDINVIIPVTGQSDAGASDSSVLAIYQAVQDHAYFMKQQDQFIVGIFGEDSSLGGTTAIKQTVQNHANTLRQRYGGAMAEQTVLINTTKFSRALPGFSSAALSVGGQYMATALAGMVASRPVSSSLTRKVVSGFTSVQDPRDAQQKNSDAAAGLCVIEQKGGNVVVRHAITLDQTSAARRELSVVRAKHRMIESIRDTLDRQIIGQIIADAGAAGTVAQTVIGVLELLRQQKDLVDYAGVQARLTGLDPTTIQVRFSYRPSFPLNYIDVQFSIDMSAGSIATDNLLTNS